MPESPVFSCGIQIFWGFWLILWHGNTMKKRLAFHAGLGPRFVCIIYHYGAFGFAVGQEKSGMSYSLFDNLIGG